MLSYNNIINTSINVGESTISSISFWLPAAQVHCGKNSYYCMLCSTRRTLRAFFCAHYVVKFNVVCAGVFSLCLCVDVASVAERRLGGGSTVSWARRG